MVAGGHTFTGPLASTEVIDLETGQLLLAGAMATSRWWFGLFEVGYQDQGLLLSFGAKNCFCTDVSSLLQEWDKTTGQWTSSPAVLTSKFAFSTTTIDASLICKPGLFSTFE